MKKILAFVLSAFVFLNFVSTNAKEENVGQVVYVTENKDIIDIDFLRQIDSRFNDVPLLVLNQSEVSDYVISTEDVFAVDTSLVDNSIIKQKINEVLKENYVFFIGENNIKNVSDSLKQTMTRKYSIYSIESEELVFEEIREMENNSFSVLKYTNNIDLKHNIELFDIGFGSNVRHELLLMPCLDYYLNRNTIQPYSFSVTNSNTFTSYMVNAETGTSNGNYMSTSALVYKNTDDLDSKKDYFALKTNTFLNKNGHYFSIKHTANSTGSPTFLEAKPTSNSGTTSYSLSLSASGASLGISYSGAKIRITLVVNDSRSCEWEVYEGISGSNHLASGDIVSEGSMYSVTQGAYPSFTLTVYGSDALGGTTNTKSYSISSK